MASPPPLRRALLAGATGLVGRAMLPLLLRGHAVGRPAAAPRRARARRRSAPAQPTSSTSPGSTAGPRGRRRLHRPRHDDRRRRLRGGVSRRRLRRRGRDRARGARRRRDPPRARLGARRRRRARASSTTGSRARPRRPWPALGYASVTIARPSLLLGDREALGQPARPHGSAGDALLRAAEPARAARRAADRRRRRRRGAGRRDGRAASPGVRILASGEMQGAAG